MEVSQYQALNPYQGRKPWGYHPLPIRGVWKMDTPTGRLCSSPTPLPSAAAGLALFFCRVSTTHLSYDNHLTVLNLWLG